MRSLLSWLAEHIEIPRDLVVKRTVELFRRSDLTLDEHNLCTAALLDGIAALPLRDTLLYDEAGNLLINGKRADVVTARVMRESARSALSNKALRVVHEHVRFLAIQLGIHSMTEERQILFSKAALWNMQEMQNALLTLAQLTAEEIESEDFATLA